MFWSQASLKWLIVKSSGQLSPFAIVLQQYCMELTTLSLWTFSLDSEHPALLFLVSSEPTPFWTLLLFPLPLSSYCSAFISALFSIWTHVWWVLFLSPGLYAPSVRWFHVAVSNPNLLPDLSVKPHFGCVIGTPILPRVKQNSCFPPLNLFPHRKSTTILSQIFKSFTFITPFHVSYTTP